MQYQHKNTKQREWRTEKKVQEEENVTWKEHPRKKKEEKTAKKCQRLHLDPSHLCHLLLADLFLSAPSPKKVCSEEKNTTSTLCKCSSIKTPGYRSRKRLVSKGRKTTDSKTPNRLLPPPIPFLMCRIFECFSRVCMISHCWKKSKCIRSGSLAPIYRCLWSCEPCPKSASALLDSFLTFTANSATRLMWSEGW